MISQFEVENGKKLISRKMDFKVYICFENSQKKITKLHTYICGAANYRFMKNPFTIEGLHTYL